MALKDWVTDYAYRVKGGLVLHRKPPKHYHEYTQNGKTPVILLPGLSLKWHFLKRIGDRISQAGHPVYIIPSLGRNLLSIASSAQLTREIIETRDLRRVVIVGHSKGGLIGKHLLVHHNKDKRIKAVIAIATPFTGTRLARMIPHKAIREMMPTSASITHLHASNQVNKRIYSLIPAYDNHVLAEGGSALEDAVNIKIQVRGHHRAVFDQEVVNTVMGILDKLSKEKN